MRDTNFHNQLKGFFALRGKTQAMIASDLGTSTAYIGRLFSGASNFGAKTATRFSELYGLSVSWLLTGEGPMMAADVNAGGNTTIVTHGDNSPASGGDQRITTKTGCESGADGLQEMLKTGLSELKSGQNAILSQFEALKNEISALQTEKSRLLTIIENLTNGGKTQ